MALRQIAARASVELLGLTGRTRFSFVTAEEYFEIRSLQPESQRKPGDCLELAQLALRVNKPENALTLLDRSSARDVLLRIQALQALDRVDDARRLAEEFANNPMVRLDRIITTGDTLVRLGHRSVAETIFSALCERTDLSKTDRAAILLRHAAMMEDEPRWLRLLEAAALWEKDDRMRGRAIGIVCDEVDRSEIAGRLADRFRQNDVRLSLLQHQIDLLLMENEDPNIRRQQQVAGKAARIIARNGRELHAAGRLGDYGLLHVMQAVNNADDRVIEILEARIREGNRLSDDMARELERAYVSAGRESDAERVASERQRGGRPDRSRLLWQESWRGLHRGQRTPSSGV